VKPIHRPIIPATPAKTGGAGTGNLNAANTMPHPKPVSVDKKISFINSYLLDLLFDYSDFHKNQLFYFLMKHIFFLLLSYIIPLHILGKQNILGLLDS
jgi:hypothetical protein